MDPRKNQSGTTRIERADNQEHEQEQEHDDSPASQTSRGGGGSGSGRGRGWSGVARSLRGVGLTNLLLLFVVSVRSNPVMAQVGGGGPAGGGGASGAATTFCGSGEYNMLLGFFLTVAGLSVVAIVASIFGGAATFAMSWIARPLAKVGSKGLFRGIIAAFGLVVGLFLIGILVGFIDVSIPQACYIPF